MSAAQVLALQRSGVGNRALSRVLAREVDDEDESEEEAGAGPLLLTDRPWSEMGGARQDGFGSPEHPFGVPEYDFSFPILIPREHVPADLLWMFGEPPAPTPTPAKPMLLLTWRPEPEPEVKAPEPEPEPEPEVKAPQPKKKTRNRKKKKTPGEAPATVAQPVVKPQPVKQPPPSKAVAKPLNTLSLDEQLAQISAAGKQAKKKGSANPQPQAKSAAQKQHEKDQRVRDAAKQQQDAALAERERERERERKAREAEEHKQEMQARSGLRTLLQTYPAQLRHERDQLPAPNPHPAAGDASIDNDRANALRQEANAGVASLNAYLSGAGQTDTAAQLNAKAADVRRLIEKLQRFETQAQRRLRLFEQIKANVTLAHQREEWRGRYGGESDVYIDENDGALRALIRNHYGNNVNEVPGHQAKQYPSKGTNTRVLYYVTQTSHTPGVAYDLTLHVFRGATDLNDTAHVLHFKHKDGL